MLGEIEINDAGLDSYYFMPIFSSLEICGSKMHESGLVVIVADHFDVRLRWHLNNMFGTTEDYLIKISYIMHSVCKLCFYVQELTKKKKKDPLKNQKDRFRLKIVNPVKQSTLSIWTSGRQLYFKNNSHPFSFFFLSLSCFFSFFLRFVFSFIFVVPLEENVIFWSVVDPLFPTVVLYFTFSYIENNGGFYVRGGVSVLHVR